MYTRRLLSRCSFLRPGTTPLRPTCTRSLTHSFTTTRNVSGVVALSLSALGVAHAHTHVHSQGGSGSSDKDKDKDSDGVSEWQSEAVGVVQSLLEWLRPLPSDTPVDIGGASSDGSDGSDGSGALEAFSASATAAVAAWAPQLLAKGVPEQVGYGFIMGFSSGFCLKKVSRAVAVVLGGGFLCLQALASQGYIIVNHDKLKKELEDMLDLDKDGDLDRQDAAVISNKVLQVLQHSMPSGGGFVAGLLLGLRT